jgi:hypothetical protein
VNLHRSAVGFTLAHDRERSLIDFLGWVKEISLEFGVDQLDGHIHLIARDSEEIS